MSTDFKQESSNNNLKTNENSSSDISIEHKDDNHLNSSTTLEIHHSNSSSKFTGSQSPSPKIINELIIERPLSPINRHRTIKQENSMLTNKQRTRSNSPRKTFSYLSPDRLNLRKWKQQRRLLAKQEEESRIYYENRQKLERLAKIAKEPSSYPTINIEQERLRERHAYDYHRKVLKNYIPILRNNLCIVDRLANVKGVYDMKKMNEDFTRHKQILKQDEINRKKSRETAAQRPFILPKIN
jgi:hypothetical protein